MKKLITENIELIITLIATAFGVYQWAKNRGVKAANKTHETNKLNEKYNNLECVKSTDFANSVKESVKISTSNNILLTEISKWIMKEDTDMIDKLGAKQSPRKITPVGEMLYIESGAKDTFEKNTDLLIAQLEKKAPTNAYDVEDHALGTLMENVSHEMFNPLKIFIYNAPSEKKYTDPTTNQIVEIALSLQVLLFVMSLKLRDEYLNRHPEIER